MRVDVAIIGGGATGLWALDSLSRSGLTSLLIEPYTLGSGQTVASQGIIHGGLKYSLQGVLSRSAHQIREMPLVWRDCLSGQREPNLSSVDVRSQQCYLWRTEDLKSKFGMLGARIGLRVAPQIVEAGERPDVLRSNSGPVYSMPEQVIPPAGFLQALADRNRDRLLRVDESDGISFTRSSWGQVTSILLKDAGRELSIEPSTVILAAGRGNGALRQQVGLSAEKMQTRPLHMVMVKGRSLPKFNGHCVDGAKTRVTITSDLTSDGDVVWQIGGQVSEIGVKMDSEELIRHTARELQAVLPTLDTSELLWSTYRVDRAEGRTSSGVRPEEPVILNEGNCITVWPTKLAFAPSVAEAIVQQLGSTNALARQDRGPLRTPDEPQLKNWACPQVAKPPWETVQTWTRLSNPSSSPNSAGEAA